MQNNNYNKNVATPTSFPAAIVPAQDDHVALVHEFVRVLGLDLEPPSFGANSRLVHTLRILEHNSFFMTVDGVIESIDDGFPVGTSLTVGKVNSTGLLAERKEDEKTNLNLTEH